MKGDAGCGCGCGMVYLFRVETAGISGVVDVTVQRRRRRNGNVLLRRASVGRLFRGRDGETRCLSR